MISYRSSVELGITLNPNLSNTFAAKIAPFNAEATTVGAINNP